MNFTPKQRSQTIGVHVGLSDPFGPRLLLARLPLSLSLSRYEYDGRRRRLPFLAVAASKSTVRATGRVHYSGEAAINA